MMFASIPSPSSGTISLGPLDLTAYGLCIALGVIVGVWLAGRRFEEKGIGTRDDMSSIAVGAVLAGVVGARLYHVATDWEKFEDNLGDIPKIWEGGLGIPGGILLGTLVGVWLVTRRGIPAGLAANAAAPAIALAQAIGRWGNYFNQELYGKPTARPWALEIDPENFPATPSYLPGTTFHPTFLYESIWNLLLCGALLLIDRKFMVRPWQLFATYVVGYGAGRFFIEGLRIDEAKAFGGLRLNQWMSIVIVVAGLAYLAWSMLHPAPEPAVAGGPGLVGTNSDTDTDTAIEPPVTDDDEPATTDNDEPAVVDADDRNDEPPVTDDDETEPDETEPNAGANEVTPVSGVDRVD